MKRLLLFLVYVSGFLSLWRYLHRKQITILTLHGVVDANREAAWRPLWERPSAAHLDMILGQFSRHFTFLSLDEAVDIIAGRRPPVDYGLVLTFDDGYRNNVTDALPVLAAHDAPCTLFVATGFVESGRAFWIDRLDYAIQHAPDAARDIRHGAFHFDLRGLAREDLRTGYRDLRLAVKAAARDDDDEMLRIFAAMSDALESAGGGSIADVIDDDPFVSVASWSELAGAAADGVTIGSHTRDHRLLAAIPVAEIDHQLTASKRDIEDRLALECRHHAYPNGSHDDVVVERVKAAGYVSAVTTRTGLNRVGDDPYRLKRYSFPTGQSVFRNLLTISGVLDLPILHRLHGASS